MAHSSGGGGMDDRSDGPSCGDPYQVLGLEPGASDEAVSRAYKKLALRYHPDKRSRRGGDEDAATGAAAEKRFHDITEARNFLLDPEFRDSRRRYDARMRSRRARRAEDDRRERDMTDRRRRMRDELAAKEGRAAKRRADGPGAGARRAAADEEEEDERLERLRREGRAMRERYDAASTRRASRDRAAAREALENRQVRLKWSRRRTAVSHSDDSILRLMKAFGEVEDVKLVGDRGNAALVTFKDAESCGPCVEAYLDSDEMRASFLGKRKEEELMNQRRQQSSSSSYRPSPTDGGVGSRAAEKMDDRRARQAAEREALRRRMEMEDRQGGAGGTTATTSGDNVGTTAGGYDYSAPANGGVFEAAAERRSGFGGVAATYPPPFPPTEDEALGLTPLQSLEKLERIVLPKCTSLSAK